MHKHLHAEMATLKLGKGTERLQQQLQAAAGGALGSTTVSEGISACKVGASYSVNDKSAK